MAFKQKMVEQLTGKDAASARSLARDTGISQETLSRWLRDARSLPLMAPRQRKSKRWSIDDKVRVLAEARKVTGTELTVEAGLGGRPAPCRGGPQPSST